MTSDNGNLIRCPGCDKVYRVHPEKLPPGLTSFNCRGCGSLIPLEDRWQPVAEDAPVVLVAISEEDLAQLVVRILARNGYRGMIADCGKDVVNLLERGNTAHALLLNVSMDDVMGYELLDRIRRTDAGRTLPVILLSAIHHAMRYKRAPLSLYGADDYIERHHLPDMLVPKLLRLLKPERDVPGADDPSVHEPHTDEQVTERREIESMCRDDQVEVGTDDGRIRRVCRVIVGDIALYNENVISSASGEEEIFNAISGDLEEGESMLADKFPEKRDTAIEILRAEMRKMLASRGRTST